MLLIFVDFFVISCSSRKMKLMYICYQTLMFANRCLFVFFRAECMKCCILQTNQLGLKQQYWCCSCCFQQDFNKMCNWKRQFYLQGRDLLNDCTECFLWLNPSCSTPHETEPPADSISAAGNCIVAMFTAAAVNLLFIIYTVKYQSVMDTSRICGAGK